MEEIESLDEKCADIKEKAGDTGRSLKQDQKVVQKEMKDLDKAFKKHEKEKHRIRKEIDEDLLKIYDNIGDHKEGIAVSSVIKGVCQTCQWVFHHRNSTN